MHLSEQEKNRYSRHILLSEVGEEGVKKIRQAKILIVGAGGLGSPVALYLAAAGVGVIGLADGDRVDLTNLQRQVLHHTKDVGKLKTQSGKDKILELNPDVKLETYPRLDHTNLRGVIRNYDFVIDGTDNFDSKFLINDACILEKVAFSHGGILQFEGQTMTIRPKVSACYRCLFPEPPEPGSVPTCSEAGVLGAIAGMLGTIQATEALKHVLGVGEPLVDRLLKFDALDMRFHTIRISKNNECPVCGSKPSITALQPSVSFLCK